MDFKLQFTDKEITPWGGMALLKRMLDYLGFETALRQSGLPLPNSNRGYAPEQLLMQFILSIWCGANRFEHAEVTRFDQVLGKLYGFSRMANFKAIIRLFGKFDQERNQDVFGSLYRWLFGHVKLDRVTLDLDSTVITRYGKQEGSARGYNPQKRGRPSHHPLMAFVADARLVAQVWLRPGNCTSAQNAIAFLQDARCNLGSKKIGLLRADSGFCERTFLEHLERESTPYIIASRLNQPLQRALVKSSSWWAIEDGLELTNFYYQAPSWDQPRRVIGIRQHIKKREDAKGKTLSLFADDLSVNAWRFSALVTDLTLPTIEVWRLYRGRATSENHIKELKCDFAAGSINLRSFWATEAALQTIMLAFNLMSLFRQAMLKRVIRQGAREKTILSTLQTLRYKLFAQPGYINSEGRKNILKLSTALQKREWISGLWNQTKTFNLPVQLQPITFSLNDP
jgi:hypothetical protein